MQNGDMIKKSWLLYNTCSAENVTKQLDYVEYVNNCTKDKEITVLTNEGLLLFDRKGNSTSSPLSVHMNKNSLETILSLKYVKN